MQLHFFLGFALVSSIIEICNGRSVHVNVTASWLSSKAFPIYETSEFLAEEDPKYFWNFMNSFGELSAYYSLDSSTTSQLTDLALVHASKIGASDIEKLLRLVLAVRSYSPLIEMYRQFANESSTRISCLSIPDSWAIVYRSKGCVDQVLCSPDELDEFIQNGIRKEDADTCVIAGENDFELDFDHVHPDSQSNETAKYTIILYGNIGTEVFHKFHERLAKTTEDSRYIVRHNPVSCSEPTVLQGYGVALDIKNMEYKTIDDSNSEHNEENDVDGDGDDEDERFEDVDGFIFNTLMKRKPDLADALKEFRDSLVNREKSDDIKAWDMKDLGFSAVHDIIKSRDPLKRLQQLSQDFPKHARYLALSTKKFSPKLRAEVDDNRKLLTSSSLYNKILMNGLQIDPGSASFNAFDMLKTLRSEIHLVSQFNELGLTQEQNMKVMQIAPKISTALQNPPRIVTIPDEDNQVFYLNNIETDPMTSRWLTGVEALEDASWNLAMIRKNMYNILIILDPTTPSGSQALSFANFFIRRMAPIRLSVIVTNKHLLNQQEDKELLSKVETDLEMQDKATAWHVAKLLAFAKESHGDDVARDFILSFAAAEGLLDIESLIKIYAEAAGGTFSYSKAKKQALEVLKGDKANADALSMTKFARQKGFYVGCFLFNGILNDGFNLQDDIMTRLMEDQRTYVELAKADILTDDNDWYKQLLEKHGAYPTFLDLMSPKTPRQFATLTTKQAQTVISKLQYVRQPDTQIKIQSQTVLLVVNLDDSAHRSIAKAAFRSLLRRENNRMRLAIIHNPKETKSKEPTTGSVIAALLGKISNSNKKSDIKLRIDFLSKADKKSPDALLKELSKYLKGEETYETEWKRVSSFAGLVRDAFKYQKGSSVMFLNGQRIDPKGLTPHLLSAILKYDYSTIGEHIETIFTTNNEKVQDNRNVEDLIFKVAGVVGDISKIRRTDIPDSLKFELSQFKVPGTGGGLNVVAFLDPLSEVAQRASSILTMLHQQLGAAVTVVLVPSADYGEFPLKRFYRYTFDAADPSVKFNQLPIKPILTMKLDTVESWNVQLLHSIADLDNLRVDPDNRAEVKGTKFAEFQLRNLIVAGQCDDITTSSSPPPNGLQLVLESGRGTTKQHKDTLVMQNLGYFQLQATPGIWRLELARGRARKIYQIVDSEDGTKPIIVKDFDTHILQLEVKKLKGQESTQLLDTEAEWSSDDDTHVVKGEGELIEEKQVDDSLWTSVTSYFNANKGKKSVASTSETIHVFSVASGHLYERFLKIMMLSVSKRTSNPVKFWLLENFLSPTFKESIPALTKKFGFQIELITYKWPMWLRRQTEKQRIIWGYKILFLDVLFPLNVKKIIYVDADQVVRADLKELWEMDLKGRAYAYTPFCDSRKETLGFQFWRSGYWKSHLGGSPYHISALYVVDLVRFRSSAAGDILRAIYDNLSRDPNSLSNLDQDLPNYAQHQLPIFSLPQEWLWCESWCSDESKAAAKTIDLCNNPLHKEPKLDMAKRIISGDLFPEGWLELDQQVKAAEAEYSEETALN